jgi:hypothetical protein
MNDQNKENRVVVRRGARILSAEEIDHVNGAAVHTLTACTFNLAATTADGDVKLGEC